MLVALHGIRQWVRSAGTEHGTVPLVPLHGGSGGNHHSFERTVGPLLEAQRTVIDHEQRGSGRSDPPGTPHDYSIPLLVDDLHALADWLDVPQGDLLGYSFGGGLALD
ncbi:alpha/beta fold hydrolase [Deinococcus sp.]|uniref:alpha/beta fold hydrolase n=1 Tax=Deinococcus sp. TaxID=47478 RepID=UPI0028698A2D|nr:alpha/beta fold hydrolase [Deinococcus sp.]